VVRIKAIVPQLLDFDDGGGGIRQRHLYLLLFVKTERQGDVAPIRRR
jgi:hypothetical protein